MYYACVVDLQIREVTEKTHQVLVERAQARDQSLQGFLLDLVNAEAERSRNRGILERFAGRGDGSQLTSAETTEALDVARTERDAALVGEPDRRHRRTA
jgi:hypothetical protein